ncbi:hypothetical protein AAY473_014555 [Plecturocebus cupreus]
MMQEAMEGAGLRGGRRRWAADEEEAVAVVEEEAVAAGVGSLETRAGMVGGLDPPGRRRFQKGFDWRNLWSSYIVKEDLSEEVTLKLSFKCKEGASQRKGDDPSRFREQLVQKLAGMCLSRSREWEERMLIPVNQNLFSLNAGTVLKLFAQWTRRSGLALLPRLVCSGTIMAHCHFKVLGSSDHLSLPKMGSYYAAEAGLKLLPQVILLASQSAGVTGVGPQTLRPHILLTHSLKIAPLQMPAADIRLGCSGAILAHCNLCLLGSSSASASRVVGITGMCHHTLLNFVCLVETRFHYVGQTGLKLLTSSDLPTSASQSAGITDGLTLLTGLEYSGMITVHCSLSPLGPQDPPTSVSQRLSLPMLPKLVLNYWTEAILLPWSPTMLGLQSWPVTQVGMQTYDPGSLQPLPPRFKHMTILEQLKELQYLCNWFLSERMRLECWLQNGQDTEDGVSLCQQAGVQWCYLGSLHATFASWVQRQGFTMLARMVLYFQILPGWLVMGISLDPIIKARCIRVSLCPRLECSGMLLAHCNLHLLVSSDSSASASSVAGIRIETGFCHIGQARVELLASSDLPSLASQTAGITGVSHCAQSIPVLFIIMNYWKQAKCPTALAPGFGGSCYDEASVQWGQGEWPGVGGSDGGQEILLSRWVPIPPSAAGAEQQILGLTLSPRLQWSGAIPAHCSCDLGSFDPPTLTSLTGSCYVSQAGHELMKSSYLPTYLGLPKCWDYRHEPLNPAPVLLLKLAGSSG